MKEKDVKTNTKYGFPYKRKQHVVEVVDVTIRPHSTSLLKVKDIDTQEEFETTAQWLYPWGKQ